MTRPNIILIITDQQRWDTIGGLGFPVMQTPNLDRLVREGVAFDQCYCTAPSCVPSRASFFNMAYPHTMRVYHNGCPWQRSWVEGFQAAGYHTANIGKMHTVPMDAPCGFDQRLVVENKDRPLGLEHPHGGFYDEWDKYLNNNGVRKPSRETYRAEHPHWSTALGAFEWPLEEKYHPDVFVGTLAKWFIEQRKSAQPLFLQIGFPGPHPPYDPPARLLDLYNQAELGIPEVTEEELNAQPYPHAALREEFINGNHDAVRWHERPTREQLLRLRRHYAANVTLIDEQIGGILDVLGRKGYLEDSIVIFTSDHGDCLGDHGHIQKWTMYDIVTRVPTVVRAPGRIARGRRVSELIQQMDLAPMLFELAGVAPPPAGPAISALPLARDDSKGRDGLGREVVFAEHSADNILREVGLVTMVRTESWKLVHYLDQPWGELYDLRDDPGEVRNLWSVPKHKHIKSELLDILREWRIRETL